MSDDGSMTLTGHLKELRNRLIICAAVFVVGVIGFLAISDKLIDLLTAMAMNANYTFVFLAPQEKLMQYFRVSLIAAVIVTIPVALYQVYAFAKPGLKRSESFFFRLVLLFGLALFCAGVLFAYKVTLPFMLNFLVTLEGTDYITASISIESYINLCLTMFIIFGCVFEMPLLSVILCMAIGSVIHAVCVYSSLAGVSAHMSPITFFRGMSEAMAIAFTTCSSAGTLPVNMQNVQTKLGVKRDIASFVLPLGATINMDGTALYMGICSLFIANVFGIDLTAHQMMMIVLTGTLASIGTAGVPGAGLIMLAMVLQSVGLPMEGLALVAGIDRVLDMFRTCLNITGDAAVAVTVNATEKD